MQCLIIMVIVSATNCKMKIKKNQKNLCFLRGWAEQTFLPRCKHLLNPYVFYLQNLQFHPDQAALLNICSFVQQGMLQFVNICSLCSWLFAACWIFAVSCNKECCNLCTVMHSDETTVNSSRSDAAWENVWPTSTWPYLAAGGNWTSARDARIHLLERTLTALIHAAGKIAR